MTMCAACAPSTTSKGKVDAGVHLPVLPAHLVMPCERPGLGPGTDARAALAHTRVALAACRRQHQATAGFYEGVRRRFGGNR